MSNMSSMSDDLINVPRRNINVPRTKRTTRSLFSHVKTILVQSTLIACQSSRSPRIGIHDVCVWHALNTAIDCQVRREKFPSVPNICASHCTRGLHQVRLATSSSCSSCICSSCGECVFTIPSSMCVVGWMPGKSMTAKLSG